MRTPFALLAATVAIVAPAAAQVQQPRYLNPRDVQEAAQQHAEVVAEFGGAETGPLPSTRKPQPRPKAKAREEEAER